MSSLIKRLVASGFLVCLVVGIQGLAAGQHPAQTTNTPPILTSSDVARLAMAARSLSSQDAENLEQKLSKDPNDLASRISLIAYYQLQWRNDAARLKQREQALWLIQNYSESALLKAVSAVQLDKHRDQPGYDEAKQLWLNQVAAHPGNPVVLDNAVHAFMVSDREVAEQLLKQGAALDPENPRWPTSLGQLYLLKSDYAPEPARRESAALAFAQFERALQLTRDEPDKFYLLARLAKSSLEAGEVAKAKNWAGKLLDQAQSRQQDWNYGNAINQGHGLLGRIALLSNDVAEAKEQLLAAGAAPGSPQLNSFGPNMMLAKELLAKGERETVIRYFQLCANFWKNQKLEEWTATVKAGGIPEFGPNLFY